MREILVRSLSLFGALGIVCLGVFVAINVYEVSESEAELEGVAEWRPDVGSLPPSIEDESLVDHKIGRRDGSGDETLDNQLPRKSPEAVIAQFDNWVHRYLDATDELTRNSLEAEGVAAAHERHWALYDLIANDPGAAVAARVPWAIRSHLPPSVARWLEESVSGIGDYYAIAALPTEETVSNFVSVRREAVFADARYQVFAYGKYKNLGSRKGIGLHGIAVSGRLALMDSPVRVLDPGEPIPAGRRIEEICAVSGQATGANAPADVDPTAVDTGDRVVYLCSAGHIAAFSNELSQVRDFGVSSTLGESESDTSFTTGLKKLLYIRVRFADQAADYEPQTAVGVYGTVAQANGFFAENSYGTLELDATVTPVYTLPQTADWYRENDTSGFANNVLEAARAIAANPTSVTGNADLESYNYEDYDFDVVRYSGGPGVFAGQAHISGRGLWMKVDSAGVLAHEIGHNLGLWHANLWVPDDPLTVVGAGRNSEYGDGFDSMSRNSGGHWHFNSFEKRKLGWLPAEAIVKVDKSGLHQLVAHDVVEDPAGGQTLALLVRRDDDRDYWFEFRHHDGWGSNRWVTEGLGVRWDPWLKSNGGTQLIDTTPHTSDGIMDSPVVVGRTYSDPVAGIHITPISKSAGARAALNVDVRFGMDPGNRPPTAEIQDHAAILAIDEPIDLSASTSDPDGDELAYHWEFGDRSFGPNKPSVTKSWSQPGDYRVRLTVSDRRGGATSTSTIVTVGEVETRSIIGRITDISGNAVSNVWISEVPSGHYGSSNFGDWSDSDGSFVITGIDSGEARLSAGKPGWLFVPNNFANPVEPSRDRELSFIGVRKGFQLSGVVRYANGLPIAGALVRNGEQTEPTDANGAFTFVGLEAGSYTLVAEKDGRPIAAKEVGVDYGDVSGILLLEERYTISGEILGCIDTHSVTVTNGVRTTVAVLQGTGDNARLVFSLPGVSAGTWHLRVHQAGSSFSPVGFENPMVVSGDVSGVIFERDAETTFGITGRVTSLGAGLPGVYVTAGGRTSTTDSAGNYQLIGLTPAEYAVEASVPNHRFVPSEQEATVVSQRVNGLNFESTNTNTPPVIIETATATGPFDVGFIKLSVLADDDAGGEKLRYSWSATGLGPAPVGFTHNHAHAASETTGVFTEAGTYRLRVEVGDEHGGKATSDVWVHVKPRILEASIVPENAVALLGETLSFGLDCVDQFGASRWPDSEVQWSVTGGGVIDSHGAFLATEPGEQFQVTAAFEGREIGATFSVGYPEGPGSGVTQEIWTSISGGSVEDLTNAPSYPKTPNFTSVIGGGFETLSGIEHNYGQRVRGYFVPPATGDYTFMIASDNGSELWIAPGSDPTEKVLVASVSKATAPRSWEEHASQRSQPIALDAGDPVYVEALHKEDSKSDHLAVGVVLPGYVTESPIPAHRLLPWGEAAFAPPEIVVGAAAVPAVVGESLRSRLSVAAGSEGGDSSLTYSWNVVGPSAGPVVFLPNGTPSSKKTDVRFTRSGDYVLRVTVRDCAGQTAESMVNVRVIETMESWRRTHFLAGQLDQPGAEDTIWGADADPDGDGIVNLLEYAYGLDPLVAGTEGTPEAIMVSDDGIDYLGIAFLANTGASDIVLTPQASVDLHTWETGLIRMKDLDDGRVLYRDFLPADAMEKRFLRVHVASP